VTRSSIHWVGQALRKSGTEILKRSGLQGVWIDVGAHHGEKTLPYARQNPGLRIYALEPNLEAAARLIGAAPNYIVVPVAVSETDGVADLNLNAHDEATSLLPFNEAGLASWIGGEVLRVERVIKVPTLRLDTFMKLMQIEKVNFLKIDTQGMDLRVLRSAGERLRDIEKITLEVAVTQVALYEGAGTKDEIVALMKDKGFVLEEVEKQTHGQEENLTFARRGD
jgi:FkbM family methyltransferase